MCSRRITMPQLRRKRQRQLFDEAPAAEPFGQGELDLLQFLIPHIQRAYLLHFQISDLKRRNESLQTALDTVPTAMVLLGPSEEIVALNQSAKRLASVSDGLLATRNG